MMAAPMPMPSVRAGKKNLLHVEPWVLGEVDPTLRRWEIVENGSQESDEARADNEARYAEADHGDTLAYIVYYPARPERAEHPKEHTD